MNYLSHFLKKSFTSLFKSNKSNKKYKTKTKATSIIENMEFKKVLSLSALSVFLGFFILFNLIYKPEASANPVSVARLMPASVSALDNDFSNVEKHEVANAQKTVIYVPQVHKEPTSQTTDPVNNQAAEAQKEIYNTLNKLCNDYGVEYVMDETDVYGPMPQDKVNNMKNGISNIDTFKTDLDATLKHYLDDGGSENVADQVRQQGENIISQYERTMYLTGGAAELAAKNPDSHVYGSQNPETLKDATAKLQKVVFLDQRINQLEGSSNPLLARSRTSALLSPNQSILGMLSGTKRSTQINLMALRTFASQNDDQELMNQISETEQSSKRLNPSESFEARKMYSDQQTPTNPYANSTDINYLKNEYAKAENDFIRVAKDQRSQEAADNVVRMMNDNEQNEAVLVYGAGHKDQLVEDLNRKGVSVIVITTPEVSAYEASSSAA